MKYLGFSIGDFLIIGGGILGFIYVKYLAPRLREML